MKKLLFILLAGTLTTSVFAQTAALENKFKIEAGFQGLNLEYEQPISTNMLLAFDGGIGGRVEIPSGSSINYRMGVTATENYFSPFLRAQARYYINRDKRAENQHKLINNAGTFIGLQTKMVFNSKVDDVLATDLNIGQQLPLGNHFTFRWNAGVGIGFNLAMGYGAFYPALGASFGYAF